MIKNLSKLSLLNGGEIINLSIPHENCVGFALTNPTILNDNNGNILCNIRNVQYSLYHCEKEQKYQNQWGVLSYLHPEDDMTLTTKNALSYNLIASSYSSTLSQSFNYIDTSKLDVPPLWEFVGLEDGRLVKWDGRLFLCGVRRDTTTNGEGRMELSEIDNDGKEIARYRIEPPTFSYCEKNWMPIVDKPFHFVKWTNPTEVVKVNLDTLTSESVNLVYSQVDNVYRDLRGGSQVIKYGEYYLAITHEVDLWHNEKNNKDGHYYHRFVLWDENWKIVKTSEEFKFINAWIEFCCGLTQVEDELWITFGYQDTTAFLLKIKIDFFEKFMLGSMTEQDILDNHQVTTSENNHNNLNKFVLDEENAFNNFTLGCDFFKTQHYPSALSFFLRSAEHSNDNDLTYESLLMVAQCLTKLGRRRESEKTAYLNAVAFNPKRHEAYYYLCKYYGEDYFIAFAMANMSLSNYSKANKLSFLPQVELYMIQYHIARLSWWVGKFKEAKIKMFNLVHSNERNQYNFEYKYLIKNNMQWLGSLDNTITYYNLGFKKLKYKFQNAELVERSYAQSLQDIWVLTMLNGKRNGTYLEIGSADPFKGNNTYLLELFDWEGLGIEIKKEEVDKYNSERKNKVIHNNALEVDYSSLLMELSNYHQNDSCFDYLQIDCEPSEVSLQILKKIPFDKYKFATITFEHDDYSDLDKTIKKESRHFLESHGYVLVIPNVANDNYCAYEDWWVHPDLVPEEIYSRCLTHSESAVNIGEFMLDNN